MRGGPAAVLNEFVVFPLLVFPEFNTNNFNLGYVVVDTARIDSLLATPL